MAKVDIFSECTKHCLYERLIHQPSFDLGSYLGTPSVATSTLPW